MHEILKKAQERLFLPFVRRTAGYLGVAAGTYGLKAQQIEALEAAFVILGGLAIDLILSRINSNSVKASWGKN